MKLLSMIITELPNPQYHHQKFQMQSMKSQIFPQNMRLLLTPLLQDLSGSEYHEMVLLYDRILRHRQIPVNESGIDKFQ